MAFKLAGSHRDEAGARAGRRGAAGADHARSPARSRTSRVGDVMGDLSSRRGRPLGTEAVGGMTEVKAEVPMSEMLSYAPDLRVDHRRPGRVHARVPALRGDPRAPRAEGGRQGPRGGGSGRIKRLRRGRAGRCYPRPLRWLAPATSAPTSSTSPATSAGARCCAASTPSTSSPAASAGGSATCARRARSTRAGSASPAPTTSSCATRATRPRAPVHRPPARRAASAAARGAGRDVAAGEAPPEHERPSRRRAPAPEPAPRRARATSARCRRTPS